MTKPVIIIIIWRFGQDIKDEKFENDKNIEEQITSEKSLELPVKDAETKNSRFFFWTRIGT